MISAMKLRADAQLALLQARDRLIAVAVTSERAEGRFLVWLQGAQVE